MRIRTSWLPPGLIALLLIPFPGGIAHGGNARAQARPGPASPSIIAQMINLALATPDGNLQDDPSGRYRCGPFAAPGQPVFRVRAATLELARIKAGQKCLRWRCGLSQVATSPASRNTSSCPHSCALSEVLRSAGFSQADADALCASSQSRLDPAKPMDCTHNPLAAILSFDLCYTVATVCD